MGRWVGRWVRAHQIITVGLAVSGAALKVGWAVPVTGLREGSEVVGMEIEVGAAEASAGAGEAASTKKTTCDRRRYIRQESKQRGRQRVGAVLLLYKSTSVCLQ